MIGLLECHSSEPSNMPMEWISDLSFVLLSFFTNDEICFELSVHDMLLESSVCKKDLE